MNRKVLLSSLAMLAAASAYAQAVVPGEFTDPSNLRRQLAESSGYRTPEHLKFPYIATY